MVTTTARPATANSVTSDQVLEHWQGHRRLTRRVIEAFPEKELFTLSVGNMRTPAQLIQELLAIGAPGLRQIVHGTTDKLNEKEDPKNSKENLLRLWDESTEEINNLWVSLPDGAFDKEILAFGQYPGTGWSSISYFIDNEIHHRGQMYVYLRTLGIEPPFFWER
ncbi:MAG: DinB family protein [Chitinophagaceae bacterium]